MGAASKSPSLKSDRTPSLHAHYGRQPPERRAALHAGAAGERRARNPRRSRGYRPPERRPSGKTRRAGGDHRRARAGGGGATHLSPAPPRLVSRQYSPPALPPL